MAALADSQAEGRVEGAFPGVVISVASLTQRRTNADGKLSLPWRTITM